MSLIATALVGGFAAAALGLSLFALWRGLRGQAAVEAALRDGLAQIDAKFAERKPGLDEETKGRLDGLSGKLAGFSTQLAVLAQGQADSRDEVAAAAAEAVGAAAAELAAKMLDADRRAITRNEAMRDEQQKLAEAIETMGSRLTERLRDELATVARTLDLSAELRLIEAKADDGPPDAADDAEEPPRAARIEALAEALVDRLRAAVAEAVGHAVDAAADRTGEELRIALRRELAATARPARTPGIFNSGRIVALALPETAPRGGLEPSDPPALKAENGSAADVRSEQAIA